MLTVRPRGRAELVRALVQKGFAAPAADAAVERLAADGWLDDLSAARSAVRGRGSRYGRGRVERELKARGFSPDTIADAFAAEGGAEREDETLRRVFRQLWKLRAHLAPAIRRRRVFDALTRRGFSVEKISEIIRGGHEIDGGS